MGISNTSQWTDTQKRTPMCSPFSYNTLQLRTIHFSFLVLCILSLHQGILKQILEKKMSLCALILHWPILEQKFFLEKPSPCPLLASALQFALTSFHLLIPWHWINPELLCCLKLWESPEKICACSHLLVEQDRVFAEQMLRKEGCVIPLGKCPRSLRKRI